MDILQPQTIFTSVRNSEEMRRKKTEKTLKHITDHISKYIKSLRREETQKQNTKKYQKKVIV